MQPSSHNNGSDAADDPTTRLGEVYGGWRLDEVLGATPTHIVYGASNRQGEQAAVRWLLATQRTHGGVRRRAFREAGAIRQLRHAGTAAVLVADITAAGDPYVVMERLHGFDLGRLLRLSGGGLAPAAALAICTQVARVLASAHEVGIVHRQVHPATVYVTHEGAVRVLDFGAALLPRDIDVQHFGALAVVPAAGTAPELRGDGVDGDARADVWGLGVCLAAMLAGPSAVLPTDNQGRDAIVIAASNETTTLPESLGNAVRTLLDRLLQALPEHRPTDARQLLPLLQALCARLGMADDDAIVAVTKQTIAGLVSQEDGGGLTSRVFLDTEVLRQVFERVERALYQARRGGWDDAETETRVQDVVEAVLTSVGADPNGVAFQVRPTRLEVQGRAVWEPRPPFDKIPYRLFDAGFRVLRFLPGLDAAACRQWLRWLATDPTADLSPEDDLATHFWRQAFESITADLVSAVVLQDLEEYDLLEAELRALQVDVVQQVQAQMRARLQGYAPTTSQDRPMDTLAARRPKRAPDAATEAAVQQLAARAQADHATQPMRLAELLMRIWEATDNPEPLRKAYDLHQRQAWTQGDPLGAIELLAWVRRFRGASAPLQAFATALSTVEAARSIFSAAAEAERTHPHVTPRTLAAWLHGWLDVSGPMALEPAVALLAHANEPLMAAVLERFVAQHAATRTQWITPAVADANAAGAAALLRAVWASGDPAAASVTAAALQSRLPEVRLDALGHLARRAPAQGVRAFQALLQDPDPRVRRASIAVVVEAGLAGAFDVLERRIREEAFDGLPYAERHACLNALLDLDGANGERRLAHQLLEEGAFSSHERDQTRVLIAQLLGERALEDETLKTLRSLTGVRFWTSKPVQQAAKAAVELLQARLAALDQDPNSPTGRS